MTGQVLLNSAFRDNLLSLQQTRELIDRTSERLATGRKVNSALDDAQNFFTARELQFQSADLSRLLDGIGASIRTVEQTQTGVETIERLLSQARAEAIELQAGGDGRLNDKILARNPLLYYQLNNANGTETNLGSLGNAVDGTTVGGPTLNGDSLYFSDEGSVAFDGVDDGIEIPQNPSINSAPTRERTIEVTFNADTTAGRQVVYEQGGGTNFSIYIDDGTLYILARNNGVDPLFFTAEIEAEATYHVALTYSVADNEFKGYLNGAEIGSTTGTGIAEIPAHTNRIGLGYMNGRIFMHDGLASGADPFYFDGRISDLALYDEILSANAISNNAASVTTNDSVDDLNDLKSILNQITAVSQDTQYRGISVLNTQTLETFFNANRSNSLTIDGVDFSANGLGLNPDQIEEGVDFEALISEIDDALQTIRSFGASLSNDINMIQIRQDFIRELIVTTAAAADDLTQADLNEEGANLLAAQTREQLGVTSLSLAAASSTTILNLFA